MPSHFIIFGLRSLFLQICIAIQRYLLRGGCPGSRLFGCSGGFVGSSGDVFVRANIPRNGCATNGPKLNLPKPLKSVLTHASGRFTLSSQCCQTAFSRIPRPYEYKQIE
ncbi:hypothetical protein EDC01DRAFT_152787 [Geopyxis carbonaria]|nr:hypothetical protein EDC01DRAFT_152787 [Geopyxis carbonaria]